VVDREAQRQTRWIKEALWIRKTPNEEVSRDMTGEADEMN